MKTQQEIDKTAKKYYAGDVDRKIPYYFFIAKAEKIIENYYQDQRVVEHLYTDLFHFYETDVKRASQEFFRRLSTCDLDISVIEVELKYITAEGFIISAGITVQP